MNAPIFEIAVASSAVRALLGTGSVGDPLRLYSFGDAPQGVALPYAVWRNISGEPFNHLHSRPTQDAFNLQIDIYGADREIVRQVTAALNAALETQAYVTRWGAANRDPQTRNYHFDFDVDFIVQR